MGENMNGLLICIILISIYFLIKKSKDNFDNTILNGGINMDKIYYNPPIKTNKIKFNYEIRDVDKDFLKEQEIGINMKTYYSNTWLEKENDTMLHARNNKPFDYTESKTRNGYEFNKFKINNIDGIVSDDNVGKSIKDIYDDSFVDYKKLIPKKKKYKNNSQKSGASNLEYYTNDMYTYDNEKIENGGAITNNLYAYNKDEDNMPSIY